MILFTIPYAGGSVTAYQHWKKSLPKEVKLHPLELSGRGKKRKEDFFKDFQEAVTLLCGEIVQTISENNQVPFYLFGHSLGGYLAYEISVKLNEKHGLLPTTLFLSGVNPPIHLNIAHVSRLPKEKFIEYIKNLGGTPTEFFNSSELLNLYLPVLYSDFQLLESYDSSKKANHIIPTDIIVFSGDHDKLSSHSQEWQRYTNQSFQHIIFQGGHFFLHDYFEEIINCILQPKTI